jgi:hypothetical protein
VQSNCLVGAFIFTRYKTLTLDDFTRSEDEVPNRDNHIRKLDENNLANRTVRSATLGVDGGLTIAKLYQL